MRQQRIELGAGIGGGLHRTAVNAEARIAPHCLHQGIEQARLPPLAEDDGVAIFGSLDHGDGIDGRHLVERGLQHDIADRLGGERGALAVIGGTGAQRQQPQIGRVAQDRLMRARLAGFDPGEHFPIAEPRFDPRDQLAQARRIAGADLPVDQAHRNQNVVPRPGFSHR